MIIVIVVVVLLLLIIIILIILIILMITDVGGHLGGARVPDARIRFDAASRLSP